MIMLQHKWILRKILNEIHQSQKVNTTWLHLHENVKIITEKVEWLGAGGNVFNAYKVSVLQDEKFIEMEMDGGDGCKTTDYFIPINCKIKNE